MSRERSHHRRVLGAISAIALAWPLTALAGIERTPHNLTATGPGQFRGGPSASLCTFCHVPHNAKATRALWNHELPAQTYTLYQSSTLEAQLQQPTGSSRLCLSCHDGTIALGALAQHPEPLLGRLTGTTVVGTDLSDDHPISFLYDQALLARRPGLADPATLPRQVKLDDTGQMQCTSCHDPHTDRYPKFMVMDGTYSGLCIACHRLPLWQESVHATIPGTSRIGQPLPGLGFGTVAENGCSSCHQSHNAAHPIRLLRGVSEGATCMACHGGQVAQKDLRSDFAKPSAHRIDAYVGIHDPAENPLSMPLHVECVDCHNPHEARADRIIGQVPGPLTGVSGVDITGGFRSNANFEYEVCLKCHASESPSPVVFRVDDITNVRLKINPSNVSFHPIAASGKNPMIRGLLPGWTAASLITCTNCHNSDTMAPVSTGSAGPHGSIYRPILLREYRIDGSPSSESFQLYALCYNCHDRTVLLSDASGFPHKLHVQDQQTPCIVCHDAHGSRNDAHLINFMRSDRSGAEIVTPSSSGTIQYQSLGVGGGSCALSCHGSDHNPKPYGTAVPPSVQQLRPLRTPTQRLPMGNGRPIAPRQRAPLFPGGASFR